MELSLANVWRKLVDTDMNTKFAYGFAAKLLRPLIQAESTAAKVAPKLRPMGPRAVPPLPQPPPSLPRGPIGKPPPLPASPGAAAAPTASAAQAVAKPSLLTRASNASRVINPLLGATALGGAVLSATQTARGMWDHASGYATGSMEGASNALAQAGDYLRKMPFLQRVALMMAPDTMLNSKQVHRMLTEQLLHSPDWKTRWFGPMVAGRAIEGMQTLRNGGNLNVLPGMPSYLDDTARMYDAQLNAKLRHYLTQLGYQDGQPLTGAAVTTGPNGS